MFTTKSVFTLVLVKIKLKSFVLYTVLKYYYSSLVFKYVFLILFGFYKKLNFKYSLVYCTVLVTTILFHLFFSIFLFLHLRVGRVFLQQGDFMKTRSFFFQPHFFLHYRSFPLGGAKSASSPVIYSLHKWVSARVCVCV